MSTREESAIPALSPSPSLILPPASSFNRIHYSESNPSGDAPYDEHSSKSFSCTNSAGPSKTNSPTLQSQHLQHGQKPSFSESMSIFGRGSVMSVGNSPIHRSSSISSNSSLSSFSLDYRDSFSLLSSATSAASTRSSSLVAERVQAMERNKDGSIIRPKEFPISEASTPASKHSDVTASAAATMTLSGDECFSPRGHARNTSAPQQHTSAQSLFGSQTVSLMARRLTAPPTTVLPPALSLTHSQTQASGSFVPTSSMPTHEYESVPSCSGPSHPLTRAVSVASGSLYDPKTSLPHSNVPICCSRHAAFTFLSTIPPPPAFTNCPKLVVAPEKRNIIPSFGGDPTKSSEPVKSSEPPFVTPSLEIPFSQGPDSVRSLQFSPSCRNYYGQTVSPETPSIQGWLAEAAANIDDGSWPLMTPNGTGHHGSGGGLPTPSSARWFQPSPSPMAISSTSAKTPSGPHTPFGFPISINTTTTTPLPSRRLSDLTGNYITPPNVSRLLGSTPTTTSPVTLTPSSLPVTIHTSTMNQVNTPPSSSPIAFGGSSPSSNPTDSPLTFQAHHLRSLHISSDSPPPPVILTHRAGSESGSVTHLRTAFETTNSSPSPMSIGLHRKLLVSPRMPPLAGQSTHSPPPIALGESRPPIGQSKTLPSPLPSSSSSSSSPSASPLLQSPPPVPLFTPRLRAISLPTSNERTQAHTPTNGNVTAAASSSPNTNSHSGNNGPVDTPPPLPPYVPRMSLVSNSPASSRSVPSTPLSPTRNLSTAASKSNIGKSHTLPNPLPTSHTPPPLPPLPSPTMTVLSSPTLSPSSSLPTTEQVNPSPVSVTLHLPPVSPVVVAVSPIDDPSSVKSASSLTPVLVDDKTPSQSSATPTTVGVNSLVSPCPPVVESSAPPALPPFPSPNASSSPSLSPSSSALSSLLSPSSSTTLFHLTQQLSHAIGQQDFERCIQLRDEIKTIKAKMVKY